MWSAEYTRRRSGLVKPPFLGQVAFVSKLSRSRTWYECYTKQHGGSRGRAKTRAWSKLLSSPGIPVPNARAMW